MDNPLVSLIITTKNEEEVIERLLKSIKAQTYRKIEIIVVDNFSTDRTKKISDRYTPFVYNFGPERSAQRNYGVKKAKGKFVFILDADMELSKEIVKECVEAINKSGKIGGVIIPEVSIASRFWEKVKAFERSFYNEEGDEISEAARFFPKRVFNEVGGYDESITGPEDWDMPEMVKKKGYKIVRIKSPIFHYERISSLKSLIRKKYYYALKSHRYLKKQSINVVSAKTIYFLRPVFYRQWRKFVSHPLLSLGMIFMLSLELIAGGVGFILGKWRNL